jgi:AraC-like DNA-binding protein
MAFIWRVPINCLPVIDDFPYPAGITAQEVNSPDYYFDGKTRENSSRRCGFQFTLEGKGIFCDKKGKHAVGPGSGFLWEVGDPDTVYYYPEDSRETWRIIFITFFNAAEMTQSMVERFGHIYHLGLENPLVSRLMDYKRLDGSLLEFSPGESFSFVSDIFAALMEAGISDAGISASAHLARRAIKFIFEHIEENINVSDIATHLKVSHEHLSRVFKQETGVKPLDYISKEKIRYASELLKTSNQSCKEICEKLGYENSSHFARTFRRVTGTTPNEFRKKGPVSI